MTDVALACPACSEAVREGDRFCEACGYRLVPAQDEPRWLSSSDAGSGCPECSGAIDADGYCVECGHRRPAGPPHSELELAIGDTVFLAGVSDIGHRHRNNEDAMAIGHQGSGAEAASVAVVCDGVSSSQHADLASHAAVDAASPVLLAALTAGASAPDAIAAAAAAAQTAAAQTAMAGAATEQPRPPTSPPATTFVGAVVTNTSLSVGWVGDSRAYWLPEQGEPELLTVDEAVGGALVRWLGVDAPNPVPQSRVLTPPGPGRLLIGTDGLFRYYGEPAALANATPPGPPLEAAAALVRLALDAGGVDNVTVVVVPFPPPQIAEEST